MKISNYGVIGDQRSAALISSCGSIDFLCLPIFSSATVFAKILDTKKGGSFKLSPQKLISAKQTYDQNTNILQML